MDQETEERLQLRRDFGDFLSREIRDGVYRRKLSDVLHSKENKERSRYRLLVDVRDLQDYDVQLHRRLLQNPSECIDPFEDALNEYHRAQPDFEKQLADGQKVRLGFQGEFGPHRVSPRELTSDFIAKLVNVEGIVTKCSLVRPKMERSVHYCDATGQVISMEYRDVTSHTGLPTGAVYPTRDDSGHLLTTEYGHCRFRNHQVFTMQELPETAPAGQLPRSTTIILEDDLVDGCKPGDRVSTVGVYKAIPGKATGSISGVFRAVIVATAVRQLGVEAGSGAGEAFQDRDVEEAEKLAEREDVLDQLANSLAPSIFGHSWIKKGLILLLLGGRERQLPNGTRLRGDINCLLVGDPGVAKSQMLRAVMNIAPLAVSTTGRGSSGVGLTAAVTSDADTGLHQFPHAFSILQISSDMPQPGNYQNTRRAVRLGLS